MALGEIIEESGGKNNWRNGFGSKEGLNKHATVEKQSFTDITKLRNNRCGSI